MAHVLVVDDSAVDRRLVGGLLEKDADYSVQYAENGKQAIDAIEELSPDIVVTDLQMPEMDGLRLITALRLHHPSVPAIVITAHGSEQIAAHALAEGAASYVPKSQLAERLVDTVHEILSLAAADSRHERLAQCAVKTELQFQLENDPALIDPLIDVAQQICASAGVCDRPDRLRLGVALEQAVLNAMVRGNLQVDYQESRAWSKLHKRQAAEHPLRARMREAPYAGRKVFVDLRVDREEARFVVRDEGPGFDVATIPPPGESAHLAEDGGRGLVLMQSFMDEVQFNPAGNEVTLVKRRGEAAPNGNS